MYRNRWKGKAKGSRWWRDNDFSSPFSGFGRWKNTWSEKRRKKRAAWQVAFDYLPDLDDQYDALSTALPLMGFNSCNVPQPQQSARNDDSDSDLDDENDTLIGCVRGEIVGLQYYKGMVNNQEMVSLVRQPDNRYDPNAVRVDNVSGVQVGHIKRELARPLAGIMDRRLARVKVSCHVELTMFIQCQWM